MLSEGVEFHVPDLDEKVDGEHVPQIFGDEIRDQEVDFFVGVDTAGIASTGMNTVCAKTHTRRGLDPPARSKPAKEEWLACSDHLGMRDAPSRTAGREAPKVFPVRLSGHTLASGI